MAKSAQYSRSVLGASGAVTDIHCEPCHKGEQVAIAEGYCVDCLEYLCGPCYKIHRAHKALANHVLLGKDSMPLKTNSSRKVVDIFEAKCSIHQNKVIQLFCETCDKLACHTCFTTDHRQCEKVKHIPDIVKDLEHTEEFQKFNENIESTTKTLTEKLQSKVTSNNEMRKLAKQELKRQRAEVNRFFDQLEKNMDEHITAIEKRNEDTLKAASDRLDQMKTDLDQIKNDIEAKNTGPRSKLFIAIKRCKEKMKIFQDQFYKEELRIQHYTLVPSEQIQAMMKTTTEIARIATARFESEIDIKTSTDANEHLIFSLAIMHAKYCVALDFPNNSVKVIDTNSKCVTSQTAIEAENIWSVTSVSDDQVAVSVTSGGRQQIQILTVSASGVIKRTNQLYDVDHRYLGMVHCAGNIYGVGSRIDELSMTGEIIRTIHTDETGGMDSIALSTDGQTLYVTDSVEQSVTSMTLDGKVKAVYKDKDLKHPVGITVDKHGYVYVCSRSTDNIHQLTADLNKVQVLIDDTSNSDIIVYSSTENKLYISNLKEIRMYSLDVK